MKKLELIITTTRATNFNTDYPCDIRIMLKCGNHELILGDNNSKKFDGITLFFKPSGMRVYDREHLINKAWRNEKVEYNEYIEDVKEIKLEYLHENKPSERKYDIVMIYITKNVEDEKNDLRGCIDFLVDVKQIPYLKEKIKAFNDEMFLN